MAKLNLDIYSYDLPVIPADSEQPIQYGQYMPGLVGHKWEQDSE